MPAVHGWIPVVRTSTVLYPLRMLSRRRFLQAGTAMSALAAVSFDGFALEQNRLQWDLGSPLIPAPLDPDAWPEFRAQLSTWRELQRRKLNYSDALYGRPEFAWVSRCFSCGFLISPK